MMRLRSTEPDTPRRQRGPVTTASSPPSRGANSLDSSSIGAHQRATSTTRWRRVGAPCRVPEGWPGDLPAEADADGREILTYCTSPTCAVRLSARSEEHTSELQSPCNLVCRLLLEKKKT